VSTTTVSLPSAVGRAVPPRREPSVRGWLLVLAAWTAFGAARVGLWAALEPVHPLWALHLLSRCWLWTALTAAIVWLARALPWDPRRAARFVAVHAAAAVAATLLESFWFHALQVALFGRPGVPLADRFLVQLYQGCLLLYLAVATLAYAARHRALAGERAAAALRAGAAATRARLEVLARKLHPHFLFNTLNAVAELLHRAPAAARATLDDLRALLAATLRGAAAEVTLAEELRLLARYGAIQETRFGGRLRVEIDADPAALELAVPHLLLQPAVENAVHHGVARRSGGRVRVTARRRGNQLELRVGDDGRGFRGPAREGLGLRNTRERLAAIGAPPPELRDVPGGAEVVLRLPARAPAAAPEPIAAAAVPAAAARLAVAGAFAALCLVASASSFGPRFWRVAPPEIWLRWTLGHAAILAAAACGIAAFARLARGRIVPHAAGLVATVIALPLLRALVDGRAAELALSPRLLGTLPGDVALYALAAGVSHAAAHLARARALASEAARLEAAAAAASLEARRLELDPGWLDGELAAVAGEPDPQRADDRVAALAARLRERLTEDDP
jgi:hypothetical protein